MTADKITIRSEDEADFLDQILETKSEVEAAALRAAALPDGAPEKLAALLGAQLATHVAILGVLVELSDQVAYLADPTRPTRTTSP